MSQTTRGDDHQDDKPPHSRLFVVCCKAFTEDDLQPAFEKYGEIENIFMPRDRSTGDSKGIAYIKYAKTSSAALAIEKLHSTTLSKSSKPIKVMVACSKNEEKNPNDEKYLRLFIKVAQDAKESDIRHHFSEFGHIRSVNLQKNKDTDECRGFAYVQYNTFLEAAKAYEECNRMYKPIFATPKDKIRPKRGYDDQVDIYRSSSSNMRSDNKYDYNHGNDIANTDFFMTKIKTASADYDSVKVTWTSIVPQKYIERLFGIIPGMSDFKYYQRQHDGHAIVTYDSNSAAAYAIETINNFEFPSGEVLYLKPEYNNPLSEAANNLTDIVNTLKNGLDKKPELLQLADAIAQASTLIKAATSMRSLQKDVIVPYCSVRLPPLQPLAKGSKTAQRCFLVFKPFPPPPAMLVDAFCRFGDLIEVSTCPNKTFGFAKYASARAANDAIKTLHGATISGVTMKVIEADEKPTNRQDVVDIDMHESPHMEHAHQRKRVKLE